MNTEAHASDSVAAVHEGFRGLERRHHVAHVDLQFRIPGIVEEAVAGGGLKRSRDNVTRLDAIRVLEFKVRTSVVGLVGRTRVCEETLRWTDTIASKFGKG